MKEKTPEPSWNGGVGEPQRQKREGRRGMVEGKGGCLYLLLTYLMQPRLKHRKKCLSRHLLALRMINRYKFSCMKHLMRTGQKTGFSSSGSFLITVPAQEWRWWLDLQGHVCISGHLLHNFLCLSSLWTWVFFLKALKSCCCLTLIPLALLTW